MKSALFLLTATALAVACSNTPSGNDGGNGVNCAADLSVSWPNSTACVAAMGGMQPSSCPTTASANMCVDSRPIAACCAWVANPTVALQRAPSSLHYFGQPSGMPNVDLSCTQTPPMKGTSQMVTLTGFVKVFLGADQDSAGVQVDLYTEGANGALGLKIGSTTTTTASMTRTNTWLMNCPSSGCTERQYTIMNVPTETPLIIHTFDAMTAGKWTDFYDYNIYFANGAVSGGMVSYDTTGVGATDVTTVMATIGAMPVPGKGLLAGEVHDCGDVRLANAEVNTDQRPEGDIFYFGSDETQPLPDKTATTTSQLGLFGAVNYPIGVPIHISAVGLVNGQRSLVGAYTVQVFDGAVTGLSLRGRRPSQ